MGFVRIVSMNENYVRRWKQFRKLIETLKQSLANVQNS